VRYNIGSDKKLNQKQQKSPEKKVSSSSKDIKKDDKVEKIQPKKK
jgi:hypothetical protein